MQMQVILGTLTAVGWSSAAVLAALCCQSPLQYSKWPDAQLTGSWSCACCEVTTSKLPPPPHQLLRSCPAPPTILCAVREASICMATRRRCRTQPNALAHSRQESWAQSRCERSARARCGLTATATPMRPMQNCRRHRCHRLLPSARVQARPRVCGLAVSQQKRTSARLRAENKTLNSEILGCKRRSAKQRSD
jgi:hypothetical protein